MEMFGDRCESGLTERLPGVRQTRIDDGTSDRVITLSHRVTRARFAQNVRGNPFRQRYYFC